MKTLSSDKRVVLLVSDSVLLCSALILSYVEAVIPLDIIPLPAFRIGLANIPIIVAVFALSPVHAALISFARLVLTFLLFGNPVSLLLSACGSVCVILIVSLFYRHSSHISFIGISVLSALAHNAGQFIASLFLVGGAVISYIPFLLTASLIFGSLNGIILNLLPSKIFNIYCERSL